mmetsp:Transcript_36195/g.31937  ORF Transcript_36195/g.31937 Transcript_36195/m.31937 type:complete len:95 (+) Transcript_36195:74-358(+)
MDKTTSSPHQPQTQKDVASILFKYRIASQKKLIEEHNIPTVTVATAEEKRKELRLISEAKLKKKCHQMHISAEGNKTDMIERMIHKMYPQERDA